MKKILLLAAAFIAATTQTVVFAEGDFVEERIGNLSFEIPSDWSLVSSEESDGANITVYSDDTMRLSIIYQESDLSDFDLSLQQGFLDIDPIIKSYEELDGYFEMTNDDYVFEGYAGNIRMFSYNQQDGTNTLAISNSLCTGEGVAYFLLGGPTASVSDSIVDVYTDIFESAKITDAASDPSADMPKDFTEYSAGTYKVGTDIPAGEYILYSSDDSGYFCVSSDSNQADIIFNDNFDYNSIITIYDREYLELSRCSAIPFSENPDVDTTAAGMFKVGTHIPAGEYKLETSDSGYYCIYADSRHDDIIANDNFEGQNYVTVSDGQYLLLSRCKFTNPPEKPQKTFTDSETIKSVQETLNIKGYDCGTPDGIVGSGTEDAIKKYQSDNSLSVTGTITEELLTSLGL